jgi:hypothetical protein
MFVLSDARHVLDTVVHLMRKSATKTGFTTTVRVMARAYETGRKAIKAIRDAMNIQFDGRIAHVELHRRTTDSGVITMMIKPSVCEIPLSVSQTIRRKRKA